MCENLNIQVLNTAGQSPWQIGSCERNHAVVDRCFEKVLEDNPHAPIDMALVCAVNATNSLQMWSGYSSYQLVFGQNPNIPGVMIDKAPALEGSSTSEAFAKHMNTLCAASRHLSRQSSEKIRRALRSKIRVSSEKFKPGDKVYYKREVSNKWKGPGIVIGQDGKVVFIRHGSISKQNDQNG